MHNIKYCKSEEDDGKQEDGRQTEDKERGLNTSNFISRMKQAREFNPFHSHPPHHPSYVVCGSGRGWAGLDTCKMNKAIISFDTSLWNVFSSKQHLFLLLIWLGCFSKYSQVLSSSSAGVMDRGMRRDQWNALMWCKIMSIIPFYYYFF